MDFFMVGWEIFLTSGLVSIKMRQVYSAKSINLKKRSKFVLHAEFERQNLQLPEIKL